VKVMYCWRCKVDLPMLDEDEFKSVHKLYGECIESVKEFRKRTGRPLRNVPMHRLFLPVLMEYERLTGFKETNHNAIMHHRIRLYGPPCSSCGKPLRTPKSRKCLECGATRA